MSGRSVNGGNGVVAVVGEMAVGRQSFIFIWSMVVAAEYCNGGQ